MLAIEQERTTIDFNSSSFLGCATRRGGFADDWLYTPWRAYCGAEQSWAGTYVYLHP